MRPIIASNRTKLELKPAFRETQAKGETIF